MLGYIGLELFPPLPVDRRNRAYAQAGYACDDGRYCGLGGTPCESCVEPMNPWGNDCPEGTTQRSAWGACCPDNGDHKCHYYADCCSDDEFPSEVECDISCSNQGTDCGDNECDSEPSDQGRLYCSQGEHYWCTVISVATNTCTP